MKFSDIDTIFKVPISIFFIKIGHYFVSFGSYRVANRTFVMLLKGTARIIQCFT